MTATSWCSALQSRKTRSERFGGELFRLTARVGPLWSPLVRFLDGLAPKLLGGRLIEGRQSSSSSAGSTSSPSAVRPASSLG